MSMQFSSLHARSQELVLVRLVLQYSASEMILKVDKHKHHVHTTQQSVITLWYMYIQQRHSRLQSHNIHTVRVLF